MRILCLGAICGSLFVLAACASQVPTSGTSIPGTTPVITPQQVSDAIQKVKDYTTLACRFVPEADGIAKLLDALGVGYGASAITQAGVDICAQVTAAKAVRGGGFRVKGVLIKGRKV